MGYIVVCICISRVDPGPQLIVWAYSSSALDQLETVEDPKPLDTFKISHHRIASNLTLLYIWGIPAEQDSSGYSNYWITKVFMIKILKTSPSTNIRWRKWT